MSGHRSEPGAPGPGASQSGAPDPGAPEPGTTSAERPRRKRRGRRRGKGERTVVPPAEFTSYYGKPVLNIPAWKPANIAGYFFLGGLAGAGSVLAAGAHVTGRPATARALKISSTVAVAGSAGALIHDLGRPSRFVNMLRVFKPTSPMSLGSWLLAAYGPAAGAAALSDLTGVLPRAGTAATVGAALLGPAVATYTAVLAADTAVPAWHEGYRELPFVFAGSATGAAAGMALIAGPSREAGPMRGAALFGAALEAGATRAMEHRLGMIAEAYRTGTAGRLSRAAKALTAAGALCALPASRFRTAAVLSGAALLGASACTRLAVFHAGRASAEDPKYTVVPQRERLERRRGISAATR